MIPFLIGMDSGGALPASQVCRPAAGACDVPETCGGSDRTCPPDAVAPAQQVCRPSSSVYDPAELCDGQQPACPDDVSGVPILRGAGGGFAVGCAMSPAAQAPSLALLFAVSGALLGALSLRRRRKPTAT